MHQAAYKGYLLAMGAALLWGTLGILGKWLYGYNLDPLTVVFFRASLAFLALLLGLLLFRPHLLQVAKRDIAFFALYGLISIALFYVLYFYTLFLTSVAIAVVLLYTAPIFVTLIARLTFQEPLTPLKSAALIVTFLGCILVVRAYNPSELRLAWPSLLTGLGSGLTYGLFSIFGKKALDRYKPLTVLTYALGFGTLFLALLQRPRQLLQIELPPQAWLLLIVLALGPTLLAFAFYTSSLRYLQASVASIVCTIEPVTAASLAALVLGERLLPGQLLGMVLVILGVAGLQLRSNQGP
ncbi:MAG: EamA family transporter [candidate division NC10 bacterium]|nr:EamA family transporter [candidate division NC10 bacterium]